MDIKQVNSAIMFNSWTDTELRSMIDAIKFARASLAKQVKFTLKVGDNVEFTSSKHGRTMRGFVTKVAIKYVTVNVQGALWRVPANMLRTVDTLLA
jgi:hypothetical protein